MPLADGLVPKGPEAGPRRGVEPQMSQAGEAA